MAIITLPAAIESPKTASIRLLRKSLDASLTSSLTISFFHHEISYVHAPSRISISMNS